MLTGMGLRGTILVSLLGVALALALVLGTRQWGLGTAADGRPAFQYLLEDVSDRSIYQQRGAWLPTGLTPYVQVHSEYPQLATWMFGVPYLFFDSQIRPGVLPTVPQVLADHEAYARVHQSLMAIGFLGLLLATALCLRALGRSPAWALLLFLPGPLYFVFSRFDVWPSMLTLTALGLQLRRRRVAAAAVLGLGAMMKWYPALLLPLFLAYNLNATDDPEAERRRGDGRGGGGRGWRGWLARLPRAVLLPGAAAALVCLAILAVNYGWDRGGMPAVLHHYRWNLERPPNAPSLVWALAAPGRWEWFKPRDMPRLISLLTAAQFLPSVLLAVFPVRSRRALLLGCLSVVLAFTLFTKDFSPQWIVWIAPLAILLAAESWWCRGLLVVLAVVVYVQMPLLYYQRMGRPGSSLDGATAFWAASDTRIILMALFLAWSTASFLATVRRDRNAAASAASG